MNQAIALAELLSNNELELLIQQLQDLYNSRLCTCDREITSLADSRGTMIISSEKLCRIHTPELLGRYISQGYSVKKL
jgi:hypothetical protein